MASARLAWIPLLAACAADVPADPATATGEREVIGGTSAPPGRWPDVAAVMFQGQQGCTGTLIAPTVVLTAGHCNDPQLDRVLIGTHSLAQPAAGETIAVKSRHPYPAWQSTLDVTVLVLQTPSTKAPRAIASGWARFDIKNGATVDIVGYGAIDRNANQYVNELQEATTTITDADCTSRPGCNAGARPLGELGAGGMGIDTCPGDSGGPLYAVTPYGRFLAGVTSRAYDDAVYPCTDGGIYARPDKIVDWIEKVARVPVTRGPEPTAAKITVVRGHAGETQIVTNDPVGTAHTYALKQVPLHGDVTLDQSGRVRVCTKPDAPAEDTVVVTVTDAADPTRSLDVKIAVAIEDGAAGNCAGAPVVPEVPAPQPEPEDPAPADEPDEDGGGCRAGGGAGGALALLPLALAIGVAARRRRRA